MQAALSDKVEHASDRAAGFRGSLRLGFACDGTGRTIITDRFRHGLFHLGKAYCEDPYLVLQVVNPTAGVFENDHLTASISVAAGAHACVFAPTSTQIYTATGSGFAHSSVDISIDSGASLLYLPRWTVLHRGARFRQMTTIRAAGNASAFFLEPISAGRIAHGEFLEFDRLESRLEIFFDGHLALRERLDSGENKRPWIWKRGEESFAYLCIAYVIGPNAGVSLAKRIMDLQPFSSDGISMGASAPEENLTVIRIFGKRSSLIRRALFHLHATLPLTAPSVFERINQL